MFARVASSRVYFRRDELTRRAGTREARQVHTLCSGLLAADNYLVDPASSHMLVSKIKPCMSKYKL